MNMNMNRDLEHDTPTSPVLPVVVAPTETDVGLTSATDINPDLQPATAPGVVVIETVLDHVALEDALPMNASDYYREGVDDKYPTYLKVIINLAILALIAGLIMSC